MVTTRSPQERHKEELLRKAKAAMRDFHDMYRAFTMKDGGSAARLAHAKNTLIVCEAELRMLANADTKSPAEHSKELRVQALQALTQLALDNSHLQPMWRDAAGAQASLLAGVAADQPLQVRLAAALGRCTTRMVRCSAQASGGRAWHTMRRASQERAGEANFRPHTINSKALICASDRLLGYSQTANSSQGPVEGKGWEGHCAIRGWISAPSL